MQKPKGLIKTTPESFIVQELVGVRREPVPLHQITKIFGFRGVKPVTVFDLVKKGQTTDYAICEVARQLQVEKSKVSVYGLKDKYAITSQLIGVAGNFFSYFAHSDIILCQTGQCDYPLRNGQNAGNRFKIQVITDAREVDVASLAEYRNYFGPQRFGRFQSYEAGRLILEGRYSDAAQALSNNLRFYQKLTGLFRYHRSWRKAFFDQSLSFEVGMYILQWQSHLWNSFLKELSDPLPDKLPMWRPEINVSDRYIQIWDPQKLDPEAAQKLHIFDRPTLVRPQNIKAEHKLMGWEFCFDLPSGAYATEALSQIFDLRENR